MVYGVDNFKVTASNLKMGKAMSSPLEAMLQLDFVSYWAHEVLEAVFTVSVDFSSLRMLKIMQGWDPFTEIVIYIYIF